MYGIVKSNAKGKHLIFSCFYGSFRKILELLASCVLMYSITFCCTLMAQQYLFQRRLNALPVTLELGLAMRARRKAWHSVEFA